MVFDGILKKIDIKNVSNALLLMQHTHLEELSEVIRKKESNVVTREVYFFVRSLC